MLDNTNTNKEVNFNGKEYLEYIKYKDKNKFKLTEQQTKYVFITVGSVVILSIMGLILESILIPSTPMTYTWNGILQFVAVCIGLSWLIHGVGFTLIKR